MKSFNPFAITEPVYFRVRDDVLVIGIAHDLDSRTNKPAAKKILGAIRSLDYILTERVGGAAYTEGSYEGYVAQNFKGQFKDLEDGVNRVELLGSYGVRPDEYAVLTMLNGCTILSRRGVRDLAFAMMRGFEGLKKLNPEYSRFETRRVFAQFMELRQFADSNSGSSLLDKCEFEWQFYKGSVRDEKVIAPNAGNICEQLPGSKGIILGSGHVEYVVPYLRGEPVPVVLQWTDHVLSLEPEVRHGFEELRRIVA